MMQLLSAPVFINRPGASGENDSDAAEQTSRRLFFNSADGVRADAYYDGADRFCAV
jgi:hypothetical protein